MGLYDDDKKSTTSGDIADVIYWQVKYANERLNAALASRQPESPIGSMCTDVINGSADLLKNLCARKYVTQGHSISQLASLVRARATSLGLVAALGFLLLVSLVISALLSGLGTYIDAVLPFGALILHLLDFIISLTLISVLFGAIYKVLPDAELTWRDVLVGAVVTALGVRGVVCRRLAD